MKLAKNTNGRWNAQYGHAAAEKFQLCWSLDSNWTALYIHIQLTIYILNSHLLKIRLAPNFTERNHCVSRGMSVIVYQTQIALIRKEGYSKLTGYVRNGKIEAALEADWV